LEEDYNSYDSKNVDEPNNNNEAPLADPQEPQNGNNGDLKNEPAGGANYPEYPAHGDSNNAEETYKDFEEGFKGDEINLKSIVPNFKGPSNDRQVSQLTYFNGFV
jgi:hypothetical protein